MAKMIMIERDNGMISRIRSEIETGSEDPLNEYELIINELYNKLKKLKSQDSYIEMLLNMQYYMEYCGDNKYVTPKDWIEKHKHF